MKSIKPFVWLAVALTTSSAHAQVQGGPEQHATTQVSYFGSAAVQEDETDKVIAKTLDEHNQRLKAIEQFASQLGQEQADGTFAERFDAVESGVEKNLESVGSVKKSLANYVKSGHGDESMKLTGRIHSDYWHFISEEDGIDILEGGDPQDRFGFRRLRFGVSGDVKDNMFYKVEMEFANPEKLAYKDAYLGFRDLPRLQTVIIGNQKRPYGLDHLNSSRYNIFMERPFVIEAINQDARRLGISSNGYSKDLKRNWRFGVWNQENVAETFGYIGDDYQLEVAGRFASTFWWDQASNGQGYGHFGLAGSWGWPDGLDANNQSQYATRPEARSTNKWINTGVIDGAQSFLLGGVEGVLNVGPTQVGGEYQIVDVDRLDFFGAHTIFHGGYVYASYFLTGEYMPWDRETGTLGRVKPFENFFAVCDCDGYRQRGMGAWQIAARVSHADFTDEDIIGGRGTSFTLGLNWYWNAYARMQFNYLLGEVDRGQPGGGDYQILGVRFMIDF